MSSGDVIIDGDDYDLYAGGDLSGIGDINGDGKGDLAVGAFGYSTYTGKASLFFGPLSGSMTIAAADVDITGAAFFDQFGWSIAGEQDVNDDGSIDLIFGGQSTDAAYLFYGPVTADSAASAADAMFTGDLQRRSAGLGRRPAG